MAPEKVSLLARKMVPMTARKTGPKLEPYWEFGRAPAMECLMARKKAFHLALWLELRSVQLMVLLSVVPKALMKGPMRAVVMGGCLGCWMGHCWADLRAALKGTEKGFHLVRLKGVLMAFETGVATAFWRAVVMVECLGN